VHGQAPVQEGVVSRGKGKATDKVKGKEKDLGEVLIPLYLMFTRYMPVYFFLSILVMAMTMIIVVGSRGVRLNHRSVVIRPRWAVAAGNTIGFRSACLGGSPFG